VAHKALHIFMTNKMTGVLRSSFNVQCSWQYRPTGTTILEQPCTTTRQHPDGFWCQI